MPGARVDKEATRKRQEYIEKTMEQLAAGAGLAVWKWSMVEMAMTYLFASVLDRSRKPVQSGLILWRDETLQRRISHKVISAIISFDTRIDVLSAAIAESDLSKGLKALWPGFAKRLKKGYKSRHEAAHFAFDEMVHKDGTLNLLLAPFPTSVASFEDKRLNREELDQKAGRFDELGTALAWYRHCIEIQRRREKGPRLPTPPLVMRIRQALRTQTQTKS